MQSGNLQPESTGTKMITATHCRSGITNEHIAKASATIFWALRKVPVAAGSSSHQGRAERHWQRRPAVRTP
jgi:hypothetical protein